ncbi:MAG: response regulator [Bacteroidia bacterium]
MRNLNCILLVDDDNATNMLNSFVIKKMELTKTIKVVLNGSEALDYLQSISEEEQCPEFIFLDINMPKMDGWEFLKEYREMNVERQRAKVILLTTSENPDDIEKAKNYPEIQEYCNKPLTKEIILNLVNKYYPE